MRTWSEVFKSSLLKYSLGVGLLGGIMNFQATKVDNAMGYMLKEEEVENFNKILKKACEYAQYDRADFKFISVPISKFSIL